MIAYGLTTMTHLVAMVMHEARTREAAASCDVDFFLRIHAERPISRSVLLLDFLHSGWHPMVADINFPSFIYGAKSGMARRMNASNSGTVNAISPCDGL